MARDVVGKRRFVTLGQSQDVSRSDIEMSLNSPAEQPPLRMTTRIAIQSKTAGYPYGVYRAAQT